MNRLNNIIWKIAEWLGSSKKSAEKQNEEILKHYPHLKKPKK